MGEEMFQRLKCVDIKNNKVFNVKCTFTVVFLNNKFMILRFWRLQQRFLKIFYK